MINEMLKQVQEKFKKNIEMELNKFQEIQKVIAKSKQEVKLSQVSKPIEDQTQEKDENEAFLKLDYIVSINNERKIRESELFEKSLEIVINGKKNIIDSGVINEKDFFCTAGVGFDAHIA